MSSAAKLIIIGLLACVFLDVSIPFSARYFRKRFEVPRNKNREKVTDIVSLILVDLLVAATLWVNWRSMSGR